MVILEVLSAFRWFLGYFGHFWCILVILAKGYFGHFRGLWVF